MVFVYCTFLFFFSESLNLCTIYIWGQIGPSCGGCPAYCRVFGSIPVLNPLMPVATPSPQLWQPKSVSRYSRMTPGEQNYPSPADNYCSISLYFMYTYLSPLNWGLPEDKGYGPLTSLIPKSGRHSRDLSIYSDHLNWPVVPTSDPLRVRTSQSWSLGYSFLEKWQIPNSNSVNQILSPVGTETDRLTLRQRGLVFCTYELGAVNSLLHPSRESRCSEGQSSKNESETDVQAETRDQMRVFLGAWWLFRHCLMVFQAFPEAWLYPCTWVLWNIPLSLWQTSFR